MSRPFTSTGKSSGLLVKSHNTDSIATLRLHARRVPMRQRVADDQAIQARYLRAPRLPPAGEPPVRRERKDFPSSGPLEQSHGVVEGPSRVDHVVHDNAQRPGGAGG